MLMEDPSPILTWPPALLLLTLITSPWDVFVSSSSETFTRVEGAISDGPAAVLARPYAGSTTAAADGLSLVSNLMVLLVMLVDELLAPLAAGDRYSTNID